MSDDDHRAAAFELIDGLLQRMDRESAAELRASTAALLAKLRGRAIPDPVRGQLEDLRAQLASELRDAWTARTAIERELDDWLGRATTARGAGHEHLAAQARERTDELVSRIAPLELACSELQAHLDELQTLLA